MIEVIPELTVVDIENAVGTRLMLVALGLARPMVINARYRITQMLGRGARGLVCLASDLHLHREVALKLYPAYGPGPVSSEVATEAQALARLKHPNIIAVYDFGHASLSFESEELSGSSEGQQSIVPCFFMSMEYVHGQNLRRWLVSGARSRDQILDVFARAAEGLAHAHEAGVAHRDFKPDNVMVDEHGRVLVVDFGLASRRRSVPEMSRETALMVWQPPRIVGTPEYMAPEARVGQASASGDQYSFAVSLHEGLLGALPPVTSAGLAYAEQHRFPAAIARVLTRALAPDPRYRYASMRELLAELPRRWDDQWRWTTLDDEPAPRRTPPWVAIVAVGALAVGIGGFVAGTRLAGEDASTEEQLGQASTAMSPSPTELPRWLASLGEDERAPRSIEDCDGAELLGRWQVVTNDLWSFDLDRRFQRGFYELEIARADPDACQLEGSLSKSGTSDEPVYDDPFTGRAPVTVERRADGLWVRGDWTLGHPRDRDQELHFALRLDGDELRGNYQRYIRGRDRIDRRSMVGVASASQLAAAFTPATTLAEVPCPSQCTILCAGGGAAESCARRCQPGVEISECGPPSPDFVVPFTTQRNLEKFATGEWTPVDRGRPCAEIVDVLADAWTIHERLDDGSTRTWLVELEASGGCGLRGDALAFPERHRLVGRLDEDARWMLWDVERPSALLWSLQGWEFALGTAGGDEPGRLSAYKRR